jgi:hypothetical protein
MTVELTRKQVNWIIQAIEGAKENERIELSIAEYDWNISHFDIDEDEFEFLHDLFDALRPE